MAASTRSTPRATAAGCATCASAFGLRTDVVVQIQPYPEFRAKASARVLDS
jgi:hypothetical protein